MNSHGIEEYSFLGLSNHGKPFGSITTLGYLISLVDSTEHGISDPLMAKRILSYLHEVEGQSVSAQQLLASQESFCSRYFSAVFLPQTPVLLTKAWSPISALLERGFAPMVLNRESGLRATATGIWGSTAIKVLPTKSIKDCKSFEDLFWAIMNEVTSRANQRGMLINIIATPGWTYETAGALPDWNPAEVTMAGRIIWKRTPED